MSKYNVGDKVWWAKCEWEEVTKKCPICFKKKEITLILGNGDSVILPCNHCVLGFDSPRGYITEYEYVVEPQLIVIDGIKTEISSTGEKSEYYMGNRIFDSDLLYSTKEEAAVKAEELKVKLEQEQITRTERIKVNKLKSFSWNAGYHMRLVKQAKKDIKYHEQMAILCKEKSKGERNVCNQVG